MRRRSNNMKRCFSCFKEFNESLSVCPYCGHVEITKAEEPIYLAPGTMLANRYIVGEVVGAGGFGIVYKAWDTKLETIVAVKEFFISRLVTRAEGLKNVIISKNSKMSSITEKNVSLPKPKIWRNSDRTEVYRMFLSSLKKIIRHI